MTNVAKALLATSIVAALSATILALPASSSQSAGAAHSVLIEDFTYEPEDLSVRAGDTVSWTNRDIVAHTVTAEDGSWDSGEIAAGATWTMTIGAQNVSAYFCVYHPGMRSRLALGPPS